MFLLRLTRLRIGLLNEDLYHYFARIYLQNGLNF